MTKLLLALVLLLPLFMRAATPSYSASTRILNPSNLIYFVDYAVATNNLYGSNVFERTDVKWWGAKGDARKVTDARIATGPASDVFSLKANFTSADLNKQIWGVEAASGLARIPLGTITNIVNSTNARVNQSFSGPYSDLHCVFGTDDSSAIRAAVAWATNAEPPGVVYLPAGGYVFSRELINDVGASFIDTIGFIGAGANQTMLFPSPAYDFGASAFQQGMLIAVWQVQQLKLQGFTVDSSFYTFTNSLPMIMTTAYQSLISDVRVLNHKQANGFELIGSWKLSRLWAEQCAIGIVLNQCSADVEDSYFGNCTSHGVRVFGVNGALNAGFWVNIVGGMIDENTGDSLMIESSSTDVNVIGTSVFGSIGRYAAKIDGTSSARFIGAKITAWDLILGENRGGLQVLSNGVAYLTCTRLQGGGTSYAISNAGTIFDGGGNYVLGTTNAITNAPLSGTVQSFSFATNATFARNIFATNNGVFLGSVGIGTNSPLAKLHVLPSTTSWSNYFRIDDTNSSPRLQFGIKPDQTDYGYLTLGATTPGNSASSVRGNGGNMYLNANDNVIFQVGGIDKWFLNSAVFVPGSDNAFDIGLVSPPLRPRQVHIATALTNAGATATGTLTVTNKTFFPSQAIQTVVAGTAITNNATKVRVAGSGGAVTSTATPTITTNAVSDGNIVYIMGTSDSNTWTAQDAGTLAGSALQLGASTRALGLGDILALMWDQTAGVFYEVSFTNN